MCKLKLEFGLQTIQTPSIFPLETIFILSRHHLSTLYPLFRHLPDTFQIPSRHPPDTLQTPSRHHQDILYIALRVPDTLTLIQGHLYKYQVRRCGGWVGGFHPNNQATSWPNLDAQDKQDFNSSGNRKLGSSVAIYVQVQTLI